MRISSAHPVAFRLIATLASAISAVSGLFKEGSNAVGLLILGLGSGQHGSQFNTVYLKEAGQLPFAEQSFAVNLLREQIQPKRGGAIGIGFLSIGYGEIAQDLPRVLIRDVVIKRAPPFGDQTEVVCHDMRKKVLPFPRRKSGNTQPVTQGRSRVVVHIGAKRYAMDITCKATALPPEPAPTTSPGRVEQLQVETRFLRLRGPAVVGDHIDGWRVNWIGGWDKGKILFVVMAERVVRGSLS